MLSGEPLMHRQFYVMKRKSSSIFTFFSKISVTTFFILLLIFCYVFFCESMPSLNWKIKCWFSETSLGQ